MYSFFSFLLGEMFRPQKKKSDGEGRCSLHSYAFKKKAVMMIIITEIVPMALSLWACGTILNNKLNDLYLIKFIY
jgi:hypothetical protein